MLVEQIYQLRELPQSPSFWNGRLKSFKAGIERDIVDTVDSVGLGNSLQHPIVWTEKSTAHESAPERYLQLCVTVDSAYEKLLSTMMHNIHQAKLI